MGKIIQIEKSAKKNEDLSAALKSMERQGFKISKSDPMNGANAKVYVIKRIDQTVNLEFPNNEGK